MDFFSSLAKDIGKFVEDVSDTIQETVLEIANSEDFYETRNESIRRSTPELKEDLNEWTLLEEPVLPSDLSSDNNNSSSNNGPGDAYNSNSKLSRSFDKSSPLCPHPSGEYSERVVRVPQQRGLAGWLDQGQWLTGPWGTRRVSFIVLFFSLLVFSSLFCLLCPFHFFIL
jgi:hypothetical protein